MTAQLALFREGLTRAWTFPHRAFVTFPADLHLRQTLLDVYAKLTEQRPLSIETTVWDSWEGSSLDEGLLSERGDGLVRTHEPRGFMIGVGQTLFYHLLVSDEVTISVTDWWEDNIADPDHYTFSVRAASADARDRATSALADAGLRQALWKDRDRGPPRRAARAPVIAAVAGHSDPAVAWASLAKAQLLPPAVFGNPCWTYLEELFETCHSCKGTNEDWMFGGACNACMYFGRNRTGYRAGPHPSTMEHVIEYGADAAVIPHVAAAARTLVERLVPWGGPTPVAIQWIREDVGLLDRRFVMPECMKPVFEGLRRDLGDPTIPTRSGAGWFTQGREAWSTAATHGLECARTPDPSSRSTRSSRPATTSRSRPRRSACSVSAAADLPVLH